MTECVIVGPYLPVGETDWRCTTHPEADLIRDPASEGRQIRREDLTCTAATTGPTPEEYRKAAEALRYADEVLDRHNEALAKSRPTAMQHGFDLDYLASVFLSRANRCPSTNGVDQCGQPAGHAGDHHGLNHAGAVCLVW